MRSRVTPVRSGGWLSCCACADVPAANQGPSWVLRTVTNLIDT